MANEVDALFHDGFILSRLEPTEAQLLSRTLDTAREFFERDDETKRRDYFPGRHLGFRYSGIEYSATPDRPDLNDSINISSGWRELVPSTSAAMDFYETADRMLAVLDRVAQDILKGVARRYPGEPQSPETAPHSWLQVNFYRPFPTMRDVLQDKHEDAHLLTLWHSRKPGLEVFPHAAEAGTPVTVDEDRVLVMPGSLLTLLTGGDVAPLYHRVVRSTGADGRLALMYFVNPTTTQPLYSYKPGPDGTVEGIAAIGARNPEHFGLPVLDQTTNH